MTRKSYLLVATIFCVQTCFGGIIEDIEQFVKMPANLTDKRIEDYHKYLIETHSPRVEVQVADKISTILKALQKVGGSVDAIIDLSVLCISLGTNSSLTKAEYLELVTVYDVKVVAEEKTENTSPSELTPKEWMTIEKAFRARFSSQQVDELMDIFTDFGPSSAQMQKGLVRLVMFGISGAMNTQIIENHSDGGGMYYTES